MQARLIIEMPETDPVACILNPEGPNTLGRNRGNTIVLHDKHASRWHAEIRHQGGFWILCDCDTLNGTRLNGRRIQKPMSLSHGNEIAIGETCLRFTLEPGEEAVAEVPIPVDGYAPPPTAPELAELNTSLHADELGALCGFMAAAVGEASPCTLVERALHTVHNFTQATVTGFLSLDQDDPLPKMVLPELARVDIHLSRQLTQKAQREGRSVWLSAGAGDDWDCESLLSFKDAVCVPLHAGTAALGALHVYKSGKNFTEREKHFCEALAGYLANSLNMLRSRRTLEAENRRLRVHAPAADDRLLGDSAAMRRVRHQIGKLAGGPGTVLVVGESGVGKELVALALHRQSPRHEGPLVIVNCAAIVASMPEAQLFGHRKGAFTGADRDRAGFFQEADDGTLFLDEIGELSLECQAKLLRVMEMKRFRPVGAAADTSVDVRILAATNRDLEREVHEGRFRKDLYFRLCVSMRVPPLRDHVEDIPILVDHFLRKLAVEYRRNVQLTEPALQRLQAFPWPGNVRQLRSVLENAVAMCDGDTIDADDLWLDGGGDPVEVDDFSPDDPDSQTAPRLPTLKLKTLEMSALREALAKSGGNISQAARELGIHRDTLMKKMKKYGIEKER